MERSYPARGVTREGVPGVTAIFGSERSRIRARVREAIDAGEVLRCVYFGGKSGPGTERPIIPLSIQGDMVSARCLNSGIRKDYKLELMQILEEGEQLDPSFAPPAGLGSKRKGPPRTIDDVVALHGAKIESLGFEIVQSEEAITLHRAGETGKASVVAGLARCGEREWIIVVDGKITDRKPTLKGAATALVAAAKRVARASRPQAYEGPALGPGRLVLLGIAAFLVGIVLGRFL